LWYAVRYRRAMAAAIAPTYVPRTPTQTVLYGLVREHLASLLESARESYASPLPTYVEDAFHAYLRCGIFAHGFARLHCDTCNEDRLLAFSCKGRGMCPSCAGRRMANTAAHLVDRVLPHVPIRQYVLSLPFELRALAAFRADALTALCRIFFESIRKRYRKCGKALGPANIEAGAVTFVQRFGSSLNLNVHFHVVVLDGVFSRDDPRLSGKRNGRNESATFHATPPPTQEELAMLVAQVEKRALAWLRRRGLLQHAEARENETNALLACAQIAMSKGQCAALNTGTEGTREHKEASSRSQASAELRGFNLHAAVRIAASDDVGRERLCRYAARPPLSLEGLRRLPDGRVSYRIKSSRGGKAKHRIMIGVELLARLAALIPPPRFPLVRYHGVLAPKSSWRKSVVPRPPAIHTAVYAHLPEERLRPAPRKPKKQSVTREPKHATSRPAADRSEPAPNVAFASTAPRESANLSYLAPNILSVQHWDRLLGGLTYAATPRMDWATLLRRTFEIDALACTKCNGRLRLLSAVTERCVAEKILQHLGREIDVPTLARARDPTDGCEDEPPRDEV
jgi:hypothetical protein